MVHVPRMVVVVAVVVMVVVALALVAVVVVVMVVVLVMLVGPLALLHRRQERVGHLLVVAIELKRHVEGLRGLLVPPCGGRWHPCEATTRRRLPGTHVHPILRPSPRLW